MSERASLDAELRSEMARWEAAGLRRELAPASSALADFTSNDYIGLARDARVVEAARAALAEHGAGGRASRLLGGGSPLDDAAERAAAEWLGAEAALLFPSGYQANLGLVQALVGSGDLILSDELNHASLIDAARLSRARVAIFRHGDPGDLERKLTLAPGARRALVLTESVFSMDGDLAPLAAIALVCARAGAWLVVDEAHACGVTGPAGSGAWAALGDAVPRDVLAARIVTGGKALGVSGAFAVGSRALREQLVNRARSFAFTTAVSPAVSGALVRAIELARAAERERAQACGLARELAASLALPAPAAAIVPVVLGDASAALAVAERSRAAGLDVRAVRPPTVPEGSSRLRIAAHAFNTTGELSRLVGALGTSHNRAPSPARTPRADVIVVAGTDTGIGKTVVSALLCRALGAAYWKPVQTGAESDTRAVAELAGARCFEPGHHFQKPASPHESAAAEGATVDVARLERTLEEHRRSLAGGALVVELAGGLLVPLTDTFTQLDWLAQLRPRLVLVARSGLGTLNHTLLSLEALRARSLEPEVLFLVGESHPSNRATLERLAGVGRIVEVPPFAPLSAEPLERLGLAWRRDGRLGSLAGA